MKLKTQKQSFLRILSRVIPASDRKNTMPILGNVLLSAEDGKLRVAATDTYLGITGSVDADIKTAGSVAVPARDLLDRIKAMPDGEVSLDVNPDNALTTIRAVGSKRKFTLHGVPGDEFPKLPDPRDDATSLLLPVSVLQQLLESTHFAISPDFNRMHLHSLLFEFEDGLLRMVATDGHRLAIRTAEVEGIEKRESMLVPLKGVSELRKLCEEAGDGDITLTHSHPEAFFNVADFRCSVKLTDAAFPPWQQVIPKEFKREVNVPREAFADAIKAVSLSAGDKGGVVLELGANKVSLKSESPDAGEAFDEIEADYSGDELSIGFASRYMLDALSVVETEGVDLKFGGELDPIVVTAEGGGEFLGVVMPLRT